MDVYTALQNDAGLQQRNPAHCADDTGCAKPIGLAAAAAQCLSAVCTGTCICYIPQKQVLGNAIESMDSNTLPTYAVQIKQGDPREAASLASTLLTTGQPLEVLHFGFQLLQAVVSQWTIPHHSYSNGQARIPGHRALAECERHCPRLRKSASLQSTRTGECWVQVTGQWEVFSNGEHTQLLQLAFKLFQQGTLGCLAPLT